MSSHARLHAQDLLRIKPARIPAGIEGGFPFLADKLWAIDCCWRLEWGSWVLHRCSAWKATHVPVDFPVLLHMQVRLSGMKGFKKKRTQSWEGKCRCRKEKWVLSPLAQTHPVLHSFLPVFGPAQDCFLAVTDRINQVPLWRKLHRDRGKANPVL